MIVTSSPRRTALMERTLVAKNDKHQTATIISREREIYLTVELKEALVKEFCRREENKEKTELEPSRGDQTTLQRLLLQAIQMKSVEETVGVAVNPYAIVFDQAVLKTDLKSQLEINITKNPSERKKHFTETLGAFQAKVKELCGNNNFKINYNSFFRSPQKNRSLLLAHINELLLTNGNSAFLTRLKISVQRPTPPENRTPDEEIRHLNATRDKIIKRIKKELSTDFLGFAWKTDLGFDDPMSVRIFIFSKSAPVIPKLQQAIEDELKARKSMFPFLLLGSSSVAKGMAATESESEKISPEDVADLLIAPDFLIRFTLSQHRLLGKGKLPANKAPVNSEPS